MNWIFDHPGWTIIIAFGSIVALAAFFGWLTADDYDKPGTPGETRQRIVFEKCLEYKNVTGVGTGISTNGQPAVVTTFSQVCVNKQEVWITEVFQFNKWEITRVDLK